MTEPKPMDEPLFIDCIFCRAKKSVTQIGGNAACLVCTRVVADADIENDLPVQQQGSVYL